MPVPLVPSSRRRSIRTLVAVAGGVDRVAANRGVNRSTVYRWIQADHAPPAHERWLVAEADLRWVRPRPTPEAFAVPFAPAQAAAD